MIMFNKIPVFLIICVIIITVAFGIWLLADSSSSIDNNKTGLDIEMLYTVNIFGTQGAGYVDLELNENYLNEICQNTSIDILKDDVKVKLSKESNLSNEDKFTMSFAYEKKLESKGIYILKKEITYTVKGLKDGTDFDVFSDLCVYIEHDKVIIDNEKCSNFVKDNVDFFIKNQLETYKEGDNVIVGAHIDMNAATDNGYNIEKKEKKFILNKQEKNND